MAPSSTVVQIIEVAQGARSILAAQLVRLKEQRQELQICHVPSLEELVSTNPLTQGHAPRLRAIITALHNVSCDLHVATSELSSALRLAKSGNVGVPNFPIRYGYLDKKTDEEVSEAILGMELEKPTEASGAVVCIGAAFNATSIVDQHHLDRAFHLLQQIGLPDGDGQQKMQESQTHVDRAITLVGRSISQIDDAVAYFQSL